MKKIFLLATLFVAFSVNAKEEVIELKDNSQLLGTWKMTAEAGALHKEKKEVKNEWEFRNNGILAAKSTDPRLTGIQGIKVKYSIENGVIKKQSQPGREKYETCKVLKLEDKEMILHCKYLVYFFSR